MSKGVKKIEPAKLVKAQLRNVRISPRKVRLVASLVRGMNAFQAIVQLEHANKKAAPVLVKLIKSAMANAKNNFSLDLENLRISHISVDMGRVLKRYFPRARGSAFVIRRKTCSVNLVLEEMGKHKGKNSFAKFNVFNKQKSDKVESVDHAEAVSKTEDKQHLKQHTLKTDEQRKMNKVQNKRRLFDRRAGE